MIDCSFEAAAAAGRAGGKAKVNARWRATMTHNRVFEYHHQSSKWTDKLLMIRGRHSNCRALRGERVLIVGR